MTTLAMIFVVAGIVSAAIVAIDLAIHRQTMKIMNPVWILTCLWAGVIGVVAYFWFGRACATTPTDPKHADAMSMSGSDMDEGGMKMKMGSMSAMDEMSTIKARQRWQSVALSTLHCGAGCTLADLIGEWFLYFVAITVFGSVLLGSVVTDYALALIIGVYFQYAAIRSMSKLRTGQIVVKAVKADFFSLTAWQVGMCGFVAFVIFGCLSGSVPPRTSWLFWFMMQMAMVAGFVVALPVNVLLIRTGIKKAM